jgi:hypothetical protein
MLDPVLNHVNGSRFFAGCIMIIMNLGGKYLAMEVPDNVQSIFAHPWMRKLTIFGIAFLATRDIKIALILSLVFIVLNRYILNEKSECCVIQIKTLPTLTPK